MPVFSSAFCQWQTIELFAFLWKIQLCFFRLRSKCHFPFWYQNAIASSATSRTVDWFRFASECCNKTKSIVPSRSHRSLLIYLSSSRELTTATSTANIFSTMQYRFSLFLFDDIIIPQLLTYCTYCSCDDFRSACDPSRIMPAQGKLRLP